MGTTVLLLLTAAVMSADSFLQPSMNCSSSNRLGRSFSATQPPTSCQLQAASTGASRSRYTRLVDGWCEEAGSDYPWFQIQNYLSRSGAAVRRQLQQFTENNIRYLRQKYGRSLVQEDGWKRKKRRRREYDPIEVSQADTPVEQVDQEIVELEDPGTTSSTKEDPQKIVSQIKSTTPSTTFDNNGDFLEEAMIVEESSGEVTSVGEDQLFAPDFSSDIYDDNVELAVLHTPYTNPAGVVVTKEIMKRIFSNVQQNMQGNNETSNEIRDQETDQKLDDVDKPDEMPSIEKIHTESIEIQSNSESNDGQHEINEFKVNQQSTTGNHTTMPPSNENLDASFTNDSSKVPLIQSRISISSSDDHDAILSEVQYYNPSLETPESKTTTFSVGKDTPNIENWTPLAQKLVLAPSVKEFRRKTAVFSALNSSPSKMVEHSAKETEISDHSKNITNSQFDATGNVESSDNRTTEVKFAGVATTSSIDHGSVRPAGQKPTTSSTTPPSTQNPRRSTTYSTSKTPSKDAPSTTTSTTMAASPTAASTVKSTSTADTSTTTTVKPSSSKTPFVSTGTQRTPSTADPYVRPACSSLIEIRSPFYALNTRHEWKTLINMPPFESFIHMEHCNDEGARGGCAANCVCKQRFTIRTMPVYDRDDQGCDTIYMDKFLFPSHCDCMCLSNVYTMFVQPSTTPVTPPPTTTTTKKATTNRPTRRAEIEPENSFVFPTKDVDRFPQPDKSEEPSEMEQLKLNNSSKAPFNDESHNSDRKPDTDSAQLSSTFTQPDTHLPVPPRVPIVAADFGTGTGENGDDMDGNKTAHGHQSHRNRNRGPALSPLPRYMVNHKRRGDSRGGRALLLATPR